MVPSAKGTRARARVSSETRGWAPRTRRAPTKPGRTRRRVSTELVPRIDRRLLRRGRRTRSPRRVRTAEAPSRRSGTPNRTARAPRRRRRAPPPARRRRASPASLRFAAARCRDPDATKSLRETFSNPKRRVYPCERGARHAEAERRTRRASPVADARAARASRRRTLASARTPARRTTKTKRFVFSRGRPDAASAPPATRHATGPTAPNHAAGRAPPLSPDPNRDTSTPPSAGLDAALPTERGRSEFHARRRRPRLRFSSSGTSPGTPRRSPPMAPRATSGAVSAAPTERGRRLAPHEGRGEHGTHAHDDAPRLEPRGGVRGEDAENGFDAPPTEAPSATDAGEPRGHAVAAVASRAPRAAAAHIARFRRVIDESAIERAFVFEFSVELEPRRARRRRRRAAIGWETPRVGTARRARIAESHANHPPFFAGSRRDPEEDPALRHPAGPSRACAARGDTRNGPEVAPGGRDARAPGARTPARRLPRHRYQQRRPAPPPPPPPPTATRPPRRAPPRRARRPAHAGLRRTRLRRARARPPGRSPAARARREVRNAPPGNSGRTRDERRRNRRRRDEGGALFSFFGNVLLRGCGVERRLARRTPRFCRNRKVLPGDEHRHVHRRAARRRRAGAAERAAGAARAEI